MVRQAALEMGQDRISVRTRNAVSGIHLSEQAHCQVQDRHRKTLNSKTPFNSLIPSPICDSYRSTYAYVSYRISSNPLYKDPELQKGQQRSSQRTRNEAKWGSSSNRKQAFGPNKRAKQQKPHSFIVPILQVQIPIFIPRIARFFPTKKRVSSISSNDSGIERKSMKKKLLVKHIRRAQLAVRS
jgi:hypothetical protein